jgi:hypothetical protein
MRGMTQSGEFARSIDAGLRVRNLAPPRAVAVTAIHYTSPDMLAADLTAAGIEMGRWSDS